MHSRYTEGLVDLAEGTDRVFGLHCCAASHVTQTAYAHPVLQKLEHKGEGSSVDTQ
jgi:hypothetical protein